MDNRTRMLVVDSDPSIRRILHDAFCDRFDIHEEDNGRKAIEYMDASGSDIEVVLLAILLPEMNGFDVLDNARKKGYFSNTVFIVITGLGDWENEVKAFDFGVSDIIRKPFETNVVIRRVYNAIDKSREHKQLEEYLDFRSEQLKKSSAMMADVLGSILEHRNTDTTLHVTRIREYTRVLLTELSNKYPEYYMTNEKIELISMASSLHDIGKITIPEYILNKPCSLTKSEFDVIKTHTTSGAKIIEKMLEIEPQEYLEYAYNISHFHHERYDGKGYPTKLVGDQIPFYCLAVGVSDCYDALTSERVYKEAYSHEEAIKMIINGECGVFSPKILEALKSVSDQFYKISVNQTLETPKVINDFKKEYIRDAGFQNEFETMLRYVKGTVIEIDYEKDTYKKIFLWGLAFYSIPNEGKVDDLLTKIKEDYIFPADLPNISSGYFEIVNSIKSSHFSEKTMEARFLDDDGNYAWYWVSLNRVMTDNPSRKRYFVVFQRIGTTSDIESQTAYLNGFCHKDSLNDSPFSDAGNLASNITKFANVFNEIVFHYDIHRDIFFYFDPNNKHKYRQLPQNFEELRLYSKRKLFSSDEKKLINIIEDARLGVLTHDVVYRQLNETGELDWYRCRVVLRHDNKGRPAYCFGMIQNVTRYMRETIHYQHESEHDRLTGLLNKVATERAIDDLIYQNREAPGALIIFDIDNFKHVNDTLGHFSGDEVLKSVGSILLSHFVDGDIVGRIGGDEFIAYTLESSRNRVSTNVKRIIESICSIFSIDVKTTVSAGIAFYPDGGHDYKELYMNSDIALYNAKGLGKNRFSIYESKMIVKDKRIHTLKHLGYANKDFQKLVNSLARVIETKDVNDLKNVFGEIYDKYDLAYIYLRKESSEYLDWIDLRGSRLLIVKEQADAMKPLLNSREVLAVESTQILDKAYTSVFEELGINSFLLVNLSDYDVNLGRVIFVAKNNYKWDINDEVYLSYMAQVIKLVYFNDERISIRKKYLSDTVLKQVSVNGYLVDENYELVYVGPKLLGKESLDKDVYFKKCFKKFHNLDAPCPNCPLERASRINSEASGFVFDEGNQVDLEVRVKNILVDKNISWYSVNVKKKG